jgi:hypothetical protein
MMTPALVVSLAGAAFGQFPDQLDLFRAADTKPEIMLLLDTSCSMGDTIQPITYCPYYAAAYTGGDLALAKYQQLQAILTGCVDATDGLIRQWVQRVDFSIAAFGTDTCPYDPLCGVEEYASFGSTESQLDAAALRMGYLGDTPMTGALTWAGKRFGGFFNNSNTKQCRPDYVVLMTDGLPNAYDITDNYSCDHEAITADPESPWIMSRYNFSRSSSTVPNRVGRDMLCSVQGDQPIRTYAIGIQPDATGLYINGQIAAEGDGLSIQTTQFSELQRAFSDIISRIVSRSNVQYSSAGTQSAGIFAGNYIYNTSFRPVDRGYFFSTMKKSCIFPYDGTGLAYDAARHDCLYTWDSTNRRLLTNPDVVDIWSNTHDTNATIGGSGQMIRNQMNTPNGPTDPVPASPYSTRSILTWRPGSAGYVRVDPNGTSVTDLNGLTNADTWSSPVGHGNLINYLYGYTYDTNLSLGVYSPVAVGNWPEGDIIDSPTVLLKYTENCEGPSDVCYAVASGNDGMLHVFDARNGRETSALIPGELWKPSNIAVNLMREIYAQPDYEPTGGLCSACDLNDDGKCDQSECCTDGHTPCTSNYSVLTACAACDIDADGKCTPSHGECLASGAITHRFYFDGGIRLLHEDSNGNGFIDGTERATLFAGLGRGGRAYYEIPVSTFSGGVFTTANNPVYPLVLDSQSYFSNMRETWSAPVFATGTFNSVRQRIAIVPSGHIRGFDSAQFPFARIASDLPDRLDLSHPNPKPCSEIMNEAGLPASTCNAFYFSNSCTPGAGTSWIPPGCYDSILTGAQVTPYCSTNCAAPVPRTIALGPFTWTNGSRIGVAYRVHFPTFDLQPGDYLQIVDGNGNIVAEYGLQGTNLLGGPDLDIVNGGAAAWVYGTNFRINLYTNGVDDVVAHGIQLGTVDVIEDNFDPTAGTSHPTIFGIGLDTCAGCTNAFNGSPQVAFADAPTDSRQNDGILLRITQDCVHAGSNEVCLDAAGHGNVPPAADLNGMVCPISAEPAVYAPGGLLDSIYWGDECGQIFKAYQDVNHRWTAKLLLRLNKPDGNNKTVSICPSHGSDGPCFSKDFRKIFTKLDLVLSTCNGARGIGVYFGTGNVQRPAAIDNLQDPAEITGTAVNPSSDRNVYGVVWDSPSYCSTALGAACTNGTATLDDLYRVPNTQLEIPQTDRTTGKGANGWYLELNPNEGVYRNIVVFQGVAYVKTYQIQTPAAECVSAVGLDRTYAVDNCSTRPVADGYIAPNNGPGSLGNGVAGDQASDREAWNGHSDIGSGLLVLTPRYGEAIVSVGNAGQGQGQVTSAKIADGKKSRTLRIFNWWRKT